MNDKEPEKHPVFKIALVTIGIIGVFTLTPWFDNWSEDQIKLEEEAKWKRISETFVTNPTAEEEVEMLKDRLHDRGCR